MSGAELIPELNRKGLRDFGLVTGGMVAVLFGALLPWLFGRGYPVWPWPVGGVLAAWGVLAPTSLRPVYRGWIRFGLLISKVTIPLMMSAVYVVVITPIGLIRRLAGLDSIAKCPDRAETTYRVASKNTDAKDLERPF